MNEDQITSNEPERINTINVHKYENLRLGDEFMPMGWTVARISKDHIELTGGKLVQKAEAEALLSVCDIKRVGKRRVLHFYVRDDGLFDSDMRQIRDAVLAFGKDRQVMVTIDEYQCLDYKCNKCGAHR